MTDEILAGSRVGEVQDRLAALHMFGRDAARGAIAWLQPLWLEMNLPVDAATGFPQCPRDLLLHAGAISAIARWENAGLMKHIDPELPSSSTALEDFLGRLCNAASPGGVGDAGARLFNAVGTAHFHCIVPLSDGELEPGTAVVMKCNKPSDDGLDALARLLFDFRDHLRN